MLEPGDIGVTYRGRMGLREIRIIAVCRAGQSMRALYPEGDKWPSWSVDVGKRDRYLARLIESGRLVTPCVSEVYVCGPTVASVFARPIVVTVGYLRRPIRTSCPSGMVGGLR